MNSNTNPYTDTHWWHGEGARVVCDLCPRRCELPDGKRGFCFVRQNVGGQMVLTTYGRSTGFCIDPIEKKPLNHFLPGTPILSFGTAGCNLGCKFCQNWDISKAREIEILSDFASPEAIVAKAVELKCRSIAFTYNDPVIWAEYAIDTAKVAREAGIKTVAVTAGYITELARPDFYRWMDAANVDLKAFTEKFYKNLTLSELKPVLETLKWLKDESDTWFEITNLIIPRENDSADEIAEMCDWIVENLGPEVPLHFSAFHPDFKMMDHPPTPLATLKRAQEQAFAAGLKYVYVGNVHDSAGSSTFCPRCKKLLIERDWYELGEYHIKEGACGYCGEKIAGVFEDSRGDWGPKRVPVSLSSTPEKLIELRQKNAANIRGVKMKAEAPKVRFTDAEKQQLLQFSRAVVESAVTGRQAAVSISESLANAPCYGLFVSLKRGEILRACRGRWGEQGKIVDIVRGASEDSALHDPRFPSITPHELPMLSLELSFMYDPVVRSERGEALVDAVKIGEHGLVIIHPRSRGLLLPQVATEAGWDSRTFLNQVARKANLPEDAWRDEGCEILTFRAEILHSNPMIAELKPEELSEPILSQIFGVFQLFLDNKSESVQVDELLVRKIGGDFGFYYETLGSKRGMYFNRNASLVETMKQIAPSMMNEKLTRLTVLTHAMPLLADDYPHRLGTTPYFCILASHGEDSFISFPQSRERDPVRKALEGVKATAEQWQRGEVTVLALEARHIVSEQRIARPAAMAGKFYPGTSREIQAEMERYFSKRPKELTKYRALMLPHAGWRFCGDVMANTLLNADVPDQVIILGPKHTPYGARWSISSDTRWETPAGLVSVDSEIVSKLELHGVAKEREAHSDEHCAEVIVPFLKYLNPKVRIVPIVFGPTDLDEALTLGDQLADFLKKLENPPMIVISSDMNHFSTAKEGSRRDKLALDKLLAGDESGLFDICRKEDISMCGLIPAVIALHALKSCFKKVNAKLVKYSHSGKITGDDSSVVGYAGVRFNPQLS